MTRTETDLLGAGDARAMAEACFSPATSRDHVGLELEWHVFDADDPSRRPTLAEIRTAIGDLPLGPGVTTSIEPGGQVELDTPPLALDAAVSLARRAADELHQRLTRARLTASATGCDPHRHPENLLDQQRYIAMAEAFESRGPHGIRMMANTAALQVNIDLASEGGRWILAHQLGPVLVAAFANSPVGPDGSTGMKCHRLANWWAIDPTRTAPIDHRDHPPTAWLRYAMAANVLLIRRNGASVPVDAPFTFEDWMNEGHDLGRPTVDDFAYHLTTLFPPVRPRGYLELRFLDALDDPSWLVAAALVVGLGHDCCRSTALTLTEPATDRWMSAAADGLDDPVLASVAEAVTPLALHGLEQLDAGPDILDAVRTWRDGDLASRRSPADRVLERWNRTGSTLAHAEPVAP